MKIAQRQDGVDQFSNSVFDPATQDEDRVFPWHWIGYLIIGVFFVFFLTAGTIESRVTYIFAFLLGLLNPLWGIYALAFMGPMYLLDMGKTHLLAGLEAIILGIFAGELRLLGQRNARLFLLEGRAPTPEKLHTKVHWGVWPYLLVSLFFLLFASSIIGWRLIYLKETDLEWGLMNAVFYGFATMPEWSLRSLWNWGTGMLLAVIAARHASTLRLARWLKLGAASLVIASIFGILEWLGWISLTQLRWPNPDPLHFGRLQGTAGHGGWMAQWIIVMWPGLLLWWIGSPRKLKPIIAFASLIVLTTLLLTGARAAWLAFGLIALPSLIYLFRYHPQYRIPLIIAGILGVVIVLAAFIFGGDAISNRIQRLFRGQDRANYYLSSLLFLREYPLGIGLGTHFAFYQGMMTPHLPFYQTDHVTSHSLYLHSIVENGPIFFAFLLVCIALLAWEILRARVKFPQQDKIIIFAASSTLIGLLVIGFFQYIYYIRIVEISFWIAAGFLLGISRQKTAPTDKVIPSHWGPRLLLASGAMAAFIATSHAGRDMAGEVPRLMGRNENGNPQFWTGNLWRTPIPRNTDWVSFSLYRNALPARVVITWPDGNVESLSLQPGEYRYFHYELDVESQRWYQAPNWLEIQSSPTWTPKKHIEDSDDDRQLGVFVDDFYFKTRRIRRD